MKDPFLTQLLPLTSVHLVAAKAGMVPNVTQAQHVLAEHGFKLVSLGGLHRMFLVMYLGDTYGVSFQEMSLKELLSSLGWTVYSVYPRHKDPGDVRVLFPSQALLRDLDLTLPEIQFSAWERLCFSLRLREPPELLAPLFPGARATPRAKRVHRTLSRMKKKNGGFLWTLVEGRPWFLVSQELFQ